MSENKASPFRIIALFVCLILGGFVFPPLFLIAGILAVVIFDDLVSPKTKSVPPTPPRRHSVTSADAGWKEEFVTFCESPAEVAFLEAAVTHFGLTPENGKLRGNDIVLEMQVVTAPYRVDFLVDGWLVVEVDGAAYHSSAEAMANDAARDEILRSRGYTVLRIPARVVFSNGTEAIRRLRSSLSIGPEKIEPQTCVAQQPKGMNRPDVVRELSLGKILNTVGTAISNVDKFVSNAAAEQKALAEIRAAHGAEKSVILAALDSANRNLKLDIYRPMDPIEEGGLRQTIEDPLTIAERSLN